LGAAHVERSRAELSSRADVSFSWRRQFA
jgi:hypothetical protein